MEVEKAQKPLSFTASRNNPGMIRPVMMSMWCFFFFFWNQFWFLIVFNPHPSSWQALPFIQFTDWLTASGQTVHWVHSHCDVTVGTYLSPPHPTPPHPHPPPFVSAALLLTSVSQQALCQWLISPVNTQTHTLQPFISAHWPPLMFVLAVLTCQSHRQAGTYTPKSTKTHTHTHRLWQVTEMENRLHKLELQDLGFQRGQWVMWMAGWVSRSVALSVSSSLTSFFNFPGKQLGQAHMVPRLPGLDNDCETSRAKWGCWLQGILFSCQPQILIERH